MPKIPPQAKWQCFFCDEQSEERSTGVVKRKYKLACKQANDSFSKLGIRSYIYFVTTSQTWHTPATTLKVEPHEMDHYIHKPLRHKSTYIDIKCRERILEADLLAKVSDPANGFRKVAKLHNGKWQELQGLAPNMRRVHVDPAVKKDVLHGLFDQSVADSLIQSWGI